MRPALSVLLVPLILLTACAPTAEGTRGSGALMTSDGRIVANTDRVHRDETARHIAEDINTALAPNWTTKVVIDELPVWISGIEPNDGDWKWSQATVHVTLTGSGPLAHTVEDLQQGVTEYLSKRVRQPAQNLHVTVTTAAPPVVVPVAAVPVAAVPVAVAPPASSARTYRIQPGDTLADISTIFYGAPEHWRLIVAANPGLDPAQLTPGTALTIPPRP